MPFPKCTPNFQLHNKVNLDKVLLLQRDCTAPAEAGLNGHCKNGGHVIFQATHLQVRAGPQSPFIHHRAALVQCQPLQALRILQRY